MPVSELLPENVHTINAHATLAEALSTMKQLSVTYLLVYQHGKAIGVVGSSDIIQAYRSLE